MMSAIAILKKDDSTPTILLGFIIPLFIMMRTIPVWKVLIYQIQN